MHALDDFWHRKYVEDKEGRLVPVPSGGQDPSAGTVAHPPDPHSSHGGAGEHVIHMPSQSYMPLIAAAGLPFIGWGLVFSGWWWLSIVGALVTLGGLYSWALEPATEE